VGIIRLSGPFALEAAAPLAPAVPPNPASRFAYFTDLTDRAGAALDQGLFIYFRAPHSYTGEHVVELQAHGSPKLLEMLQQEILQDDRVRPAEPGEFTRRAFLNARVDLARAEAVADLVAAESEAAVRAATSQMRGIFSTRIGQLREPLLALRVELEGHLNFPLETEGEEMDCRGKLSSLLEMAKTLLAQTQQGRLIRRGVRVALVGPVNAGKSTLFNQLLGEQRALIDSDPGTTRDVLEARLELQGLSVMLLDTAGLRAKPGRIEALGIERTLEAAESSDLVLLVLPADASDVDREGWTSQLGNRPLLRVRSKMDLSPDLRLDGEIGVSGLTGDGIEGLRAALLSRLWTDGLPQAVEGTSARHAEALRRVVHSLDRATEAERMSTLEVISGELGLALEALGSITGESATADLLDEIFRRFCIGK
jgi:tRNA modification GTPase